MFVSVVSLFSTFHNRNEKSELKMKKIWNHFMKLNKSLLKFKKQIKMFMFKWYADWSIQNVFLRHKGAASIIKRHNCEHQRRYLSFNFARNLFDGRPLLNKSRDPRAIDIILKIPLLYKDEERSRRLTVPWREYGGEFTWVARLCFLIRRNQQKLNLVTIVGIIPRLAFVKKK